MSSGFVSGGTVDKPIERDDEWRQAQAELDDQRRHKDQAAQDGGKSLYEVLQANKAAKQEAFEEATRLKNQYRALDDDEAEFLASVLDSTRQQEAEVNKETLQQLGAFRRQQEETEKRALEQQNTNDLRDDDALWKAGGRKRKKGHDTGLLKGVKLRKASSAANAVEEGETNIATATTKRNASPGSAPKEGEPRDTMNLATRNAVPKPTTSASHQSTQKPTHAVSLGLGYASSDNDD